MYIKAGLILSIQKKKMQCKIGTKEKKILHKKLKKKKPTDYVPEKIIKIFDYYV